MTKLENQLKCESDFSLDSASSATMTTLIDGLLESCLTTYLPQNLQKNVDRPFVTLTYAQSLDSRIAAQPGERTAISHQETKTMTHYLRSKHDAILVGVGTVLADDPKLNCRYKKAVSFQSEASTIKPVIIDPKSKWKYLNSQLHQLVKSGEAKAPYIVIDQNTTLSDEETNCLKESGGNYIVLPLLGKSNVDQWNLILKALKDLDIKSVMIEGGARVINDLLKIQAREYKIIDSLIITIGPVFLGKDGVEVSPVSSLDLRFVRWWSGERDSVLAALPN